MMAFDDHFDRLLEHTTYLTSADQERLKRAYALAKRAHAGQMRRTGDPYISHPVAVAETLADLKLDNATLTAALLHDVPEDTAIDLTQIQANFGKEVASLVDGVTKLGQIRLKKSWHDVYRGFLKERAQTTENFADFDRHVETLRKIFLAMSHDIRVVLLKLADRLSNLETLHALDPSRKQRIAQETLEVYAPLANRLGMGQLKGRLEDLAFPFALPDAYAELKRLVSDEYRVRERYAEKVRRVLLKRLARAGIKAEAHGRAKHFYSLWKKYLRHDKNLETIYDLVAVRIIVPSIEECYRVLGLIHSMWKPLPGRIKDYIATPKPNGYQSLHTTVFALGGKITELQIRTPAIHSWAEFGVAAHWLYKDSLTRPLTSGQPLKLDQLSHDRLTWIKELATLKDRLADPDLWKKRLVTDFFADRIFVFTPKGDVLDLPHGATAIDVAYAIHSDLGDHCNGAKVNGKIVPLSQELANGDILEILTAAKAKPKRDWLKFTTTSKARSHIKRFLKLA